MKPTALFATPLMVTLAAVVSASANAQSAPPIPGYTMGQKALARAPYAAWVKSVLLQTILWSYPYVREGQF